jgi:predicted DNA binding CopG/RHH family protein
MKQKRKRSAAKQVEAWEKTASLFENQEKSLAAMKKSRVLSASQRRKLLGPGKTQQISLRIPKEDLEAVKEVAEAHDRPYQQLVVIAIQQFLDRIAEAEKKGA